jgi:hypothetical protein
VLNRWWHTTDSTRRRLPLHGLLHRTIGRLLASIPRLAYVVLQFRGVVLLHDMAQFVYDERATGR